MMTRTLHVGAGTTRGSLTVFPVWGEYVDLGRPFLTSERVEVTEQEGGATVGSLRVWNGAELPALMFQGQVVEGDWQNRMLARSVVVPARDHADLDVVCVEQGRWQGGAHHRVADRRGSGRVRAALADSANRQGAVWAQVSEYERLDGPTATTSYTEHADRRGAAVELLVAGIRALPGQIGVVVGLSGQPFLAEVFDTHETLVRQFDAIIRAAAVDAVGLSAVETPSRRARRFVDRATRVHTRAAEPAGLGQTVRGGNEYADVVGLEWNAAAVHVVMTNPRHALATVGV